MRLAPLYGGLLLGLAVASSGAAAPAWKVNRPVSGSPLVEAGIEGRADSLRRRVPASLVVSCRADAPPATLSVLLPATGLGFELEPFEGAEGAGQRSSLARLYLGRERGQPVAVIGWRADAGLFRLSMHLPAQQVQRLLQTHSVVLKVSTADGKRGDLRLSFVLPDEAQPLRTALAGCGV
jgi:hypothetical protein